MGKLPHHSKTHNVDQFVSIMDRIGRFIIVNKIALISIGAVLVASGLFYIFSLYKTESDILSFNDEFYEASKLPDEEKKKALEDLYEKYSNLPISSLALLNKQTDKEEKITVLEEAQKLNHPLLSPVSSIEEIFTLLQLGKKEEALKKCDAIKNEGGVLTYYPSYLKGLILEEMKKTDEAQKVYEDILNSMIEQSPLRQAVADRLIWIQTQS